MDSLQGFKLRDVLFLKEREGQGGRELMCDLARLVYECQPVGVTFPGANENRSRLLRDARGMGTPARARRAYADIAVRIYWKDRRLPPIV